MTNVHDYGARGDGLHDDTAALSHAIQRGDGHLVFPPGDYLLSAPLHVDLRLHGRIAVEGSGGTARLLMAGPGPALHLVGSHGRSAHPDQFADGVWRKERMPTVRDLEIVGLHPEADGIRIEGAMQPTLQGVLVRRCGHGIILANRDRNVLIADCHIYHNTGVGILFDHVNLHQTNIHGSHISYNQQGGIKIVGSEIRNLQICSNDIEYNYDLKAPTSADVLFDCRQGTVREGTIVGNTIQAVESPGGANIRFVGAKDHPNAIGMFSITGNLIGSQTTVIDLVACRGVVISGNSIYSGYSHSLRAQDCEHLVIGPNSIDHNPDYKGNSTDQVLLTNCRNVSLTGLILQHTRAATRPVSSSLVLDHCHGVSVTGCQILSARTRGISVDESSVIRIADCTIRGREGDKTYTAPLLVTGNCRQVMVTSNFLGRGREGDFTLPNEVGTATGNVMV